jgi:hypothetical protein
MLAIRLPTLNGDSSGKGAVCYLGYLLLPMGLFLWECVKDRVYVWIVACDIKDLKIKIHELISTHWAKWGMSFYKLWTLFVLQMVLTLNIYEMKKDFSSFFIQW